MSTQEQTKDSWVSKLLINNPKENIRGILLAFNGGYTVCFKDSAGCNTMLSGHDSASEKDLNDLKESGIPIVNFSTDKLQSNLVSRLPMIGRDMRDGPINGMSKASFEVYANMAEKFGAQVFNVRRINFIPEMFNYTDRSTEFVDLISKGLGMQAILKASLDGWRDNLSFLSANIDDFPLSEVLKPLRAIIEQQKEILNDNEYSRDDDEKTRSDKSAVRYKTDHFHRNLVDFYNQAHWNALMVKAGNFTLSEAAACTMKDLQDHLYQLKEDNKKMASGAGYKGIRDAANEFKSEASKAAALLKKLISKDDLAIIREYEPGYH